MFGFWDSTEDTPPPPARSAIFVMRNGRYEPQNLMPVLPRPDALDFDGFVARRGAAAGYLNPRPPEMRQACLVKNPASIRRDSARIVRGGSPRSFESATGDGSIVISITFDALRPCKISLYTRVTEVERSSGPNAAAMERSIELRPQSLAAGSTQEPGAAGELLQQGKQQDEVAAAPLDMRSFPAGLGQIYESPSLGLEGWPEAAITHSTSRPRDIPVAIRVDADAANGEEACVQFTYISVNRIPTSPTASPDPDRPLWTVQVIAQKLEYSGQCFILHEVFGVSSKQMPEADIEGGSSDCVICLSEPRDTAVLPCRHMCFCGYCAGIVRLQCDRCPVCRQKVASLLQFRREREQKPASLGAMETVKEEAANATSAAAPASHNTPAQHPH